MEGLNCDDINLIDSVNNAGAGCIRHFEHNYEMICFSTTSKTLQSIGHVIMYMSNAAHPDNILLHCSIKLFQEQLNSSFLSLYTYSEPDYIEEMERQIILLQHHLNFILRDLEQLRRIEHRLL
ncbi:unnamed protein product [Caenorhabditis angaria]|uniref:Uncharacterized protein n=1 Tax=Caenorhabditis angaria TaxID=860376 RepID=A0A9P1J4F7_9PELO|nr:unnamed protein product [Caenorhabditis angaria]